ncbi:MAG TPA: hypothetical protein VJA23_02720 [Candidatus Nanoarchaeia archaeon]|nr:hypothetical protein [Candidatus Nanoarchaeia archaeon]
MSEKKFSKALEKELQKEEMLDIEKAVQEDLDLPENDSRDTKTILFTILILVGVFGLFLGGFKLYSNQLTTAAVVDVDQLHQDNLAGDLNEEEGYIYNDYSFVKVDGLWWTEMNKFGTLLKIPLHFGPKEVESIQFEGNLNPEFNLGDSVYIAIDPKVINKYYTLAISELSFNVVKGMDRAPIGSCTEEGYGCDNRTLISCENNPQNLPVIELAIANETTVKGAGTCLKISGDGYDLVKAVDRVLYQWYGIME